MNRIKIGALALLFITLSPGPASAQTHTNTWPRPRPQLPGFSTRPPGVPPATAWNNKRFVSFHSSSFHLTTNFLVLQIQTGEEVPKAIAVMVKPLRAAAPPTFHSATNMAQMREAANARRAAFDAQVAEGRLDWKEAHWIPFTTNLPVDLGPGEGKRLVSLGARWDTTYLEYSQGTHVWVDRTPPHITITNPTAIVISQPMIQLQGYSDEELQSIRYDLENATNHIADAEGNINHQQHDAVDPDHVRSHFTCYDIELALGTNTIELRCQDLAGNIATNRLTYVFTLDQDKTPPVIALDQPKNGHSWMDETLTARGRLDDPTARIAAVVSSSGQTNSIQGLVERNGYFWVEHIPLGPGANYLTVTATDAAGNAASTNLVIYKDDSVRVTMDPVPGDQLWKREVTATGKITPSNQRVFINGVEAKVKPDGSWIASRVPVKSPNGGTAVFEMTALPLAEPSAGAAGTNKPLLATKPYELLSVLAGLSTNAMTLNVGQPACGSFNLHLSDTAGRSFVLQASTNLVDWTPILTNLSSGPAFDFTDANVANYKCRFFRVLPFP